jgi:hypothetical protein
MNLSGTGAGQNTANAGIVQNTEIAQEAACTTGMAIRATYLFVTMRR